MLRRFGRIVEDLDIGKKPSDSEEVICLDVSVGNRRRPTMFLVISSQANFNMLLGRE